MTAKRVLYPMTMDVSFYLINTEGDVAKITIGFLGGSIPTDEQIKEKLAEQVATMQGDGEGLKGSFRLCDYQEVCNAKLSETNPVASLAGPFAWTMPEDAVWHTDLEGCGCETCKPEPAKWPHPTKEEQQRAAENYHTSPTGLDADGRAED